MGWERGIVTDSGGFQVYSLSQLREIDDNGITFVSHLDGSKHSLDPEKVVQIQNELNPDIAMVLDVFTPYPSQFLDARIAVERTLSWAKRSLCVPTRLSLFAIVQGATYAGLREECARRLVDLDFAGYGIGGLMTKNLIIIVNYLIPL